MTFWYESAEENLANATRDAVEESKSTNESGEDAVELEEVKFDEADIPKKAVLRGFDLNIKPGEFVGIVGTTGRAEDK